MIIVRMKCETQYPESTPKSRSHRSWWGTAIDRSHIYGNASGKYHTMHHFLTYVHTCAHFCHRMVHCAIMNRCTVGSIRLFHSCLRFTTKAQWNKSVFKWNIMWLRSPYRTCARNKVENFMSGINMTKVMSKWCKIYSSLDCKYPSNICRHFAGVAATYGDRSSRVTMWKFSFRFRWSLVIPVAV